MLGSIVEMFWCSVGMLFELLVKNIVLIWFGLILVEVSSCVMLLCMCFSSLLMVFLNSLWVSFMLSLVSMCFSERCRCLVLVRWILLFFICIVS